MDKIRKYLAALMSFVLVVGSAPVIADGGIESAPPAVIEIIEEEGEPDGENPEGGEPEGGEPEGGEPEGGEPEGGEPEGGEPEGGEPEGGEPEGGEPEGDVIPQKITFGVSEFVVDITECTEGFDPAVIFGAEFTEMDAGSVVWSVSDENVAAFEDGMLVVRDGGVVTVRAEYSENPEVFAEAVVRVEKAVVIVGLPETVLEDDVFTLSVTLLDGTPVPAEDITWASADDSAAVADGVVTVGAFAGAAEITATAYGKTAAVSFEILPRKVEFTANFDPIFSNSTGYIQITPVDENEVIDYSRAVFTPAAGYYRYFYIDENGAVVPVPQNGTWTTSTSGNSVHLSGGVLENGKDSITIDVQVEYRGTTVTVPVTIKQAAVGAYSSYGVIELHIGKEVNLADYITLAPTPNCDSIVSIRSSNKNIFTVSDDNIAVATAGGAGFFIITTESGRVIYMPVSCVVETTEVELIIPSGNLRMGESADIILKRYPEEADDSVVWTTSNSQIISVDQNGHVEFINPGEATVTVTVQSTGITESVKLKVIRPAEGFTLYKGVFPDRKNFTIAVGQTFTPVIEVYPNNASNTGYYMVSSDSSVLQVTNNGKSVKGVKAGYATVTVYSSDGEVSMTLDFTVPVKKYALTSFKLSTSSVTLTEGSSKTVTAKINSSAYDKTVEWVSTDPEIATVENGKIVAVNPGKCTVYAMNSAGQYKSVKVTVNMKVPSSVKLNVTKGSMYVGDEYQFIATLNPATLPREEAMKLTWSTSNKNVVIVNEEGKIFAISPGTATITVKTVNGKKATCKVTVKPYKVTSVKITHPYTEFAVGGTYDLDVLIGPDNATNKNVTWSSSSTSRVSVNKNTGVITCKKTGTVTITAKANDGSGKKATLKITVVNVPLKSQTVSFGDTVVDNNATYTMNYKDTVQVTAATDPVMYIDYATSDSRVASIDNNGLITATGCGTAKITVTAGGKYKTTFYVNVPYSEDAPRYRALVISQFTQSGASGYLPFSTNSTSGVIDAISLSDLEGSRYDVTYKKDFTTPEQVVNCINSTFEDAEEGDVSVIYIITHGNVNNGQFRWHLKGTGNKTVWLYPSEVMGALAGIKGDVVLVVLSCYSGGDIEQEGTLQNMVAELDNGGGVGTSYSVICSTDGATRSSYANTAASFSYDFFSYGLCKSLGWDMTTSRKAATSADTDGDGKITLKELAKATKVFTKEECERFVDVYGTSAYWGPKTGEKTQNVQYYISDKAQELTVFSAIH